MAGAASFFFFFVTILHLVTMSFLCREEELRRRLAVKRKEIELEDKLVERVEE